VLVENIRPAGRRFGRPFLHSERKLYGAFVCILRAYTEKIRYIQLGKRNASSRPEMSPENSIPDLKDRAAYYSIPV